MIKAEELRYKFQEKMKDGIPTPPGEFHHKDLSKLKDEKYLTRVIEHCDGNLDNALEMLWSTLVWRKMEKVNEIEDTVNMEYVKEGIFFPHGRDVDGSLLFIMKWKLYNKEYRSEESKKVIIYWLERLEREESGRPLTLFFDLDGCGINNMDPELIGYMIKILKSYYPKFVNYIVIYQMPWILTAGYRIVKGLLPARAVERLRLINRDNINEFINQEQALKSWGGDDEYKFSFKPETSSKISKDTIDHGMVRIIPDGYLTFTNQKNTELTIINMVRKYVAYKILSTAPEKFRVKPTSGVLPPGTSQTVSITVSSGVDISIAMKEKFMVVTSEIGEGDITQELVDKVWKDSKKYEFILKCKSDDEVSEAVKDCLVRLNSKYSELYHDLDLVQILQFLIFSFSIILVISEYLIFKGSRIWC